MHEDKSVYVCLHVRAVCWCVPPSFIPMSKMSSDSSLCDGVEILVFNNWTSLRVCAISEKRDWLLLSKFYRKVSVRGWLSGIHPLTDVLKYKTSCDNNMIQFRMAISTKFVSRSISHWVDYRALHSVSEEAHTARLNLARAFFLRGNTLQQKLPSSCINLIN